MSKKTAWSIRQHKFFKIILTKNAPHLFQIVINKVFSEIDDAHCYIHDIFVTSKNARDYYDDF